MQTPPYVKAALAGLFATVPGYTTSAAFYEGNVPEVFASRRLRRLLAGTGKEFRVNYARTPVDALLERTMVQGITCADARAAAVLDTAWEANDLGLEAKDVHRRAYEYGDGYLIGWPDDTIDGGVALYGHEPTCVRVFYDQVKPRTKSLAVQAWTEFDVDGSWFRANLYYPDRTEMWISANAINVIAGQATVNFPELEMTPYLTDEAPDGIVPNELGIIPVFHFRTARPYGRSELEDAKGPQAMINKLYVTMMSSVDYAGFPQRYVLTDNSLEPDDQQDAFSQPVRNELAATDHTGLTHDSSLEAGPGATWLLSGNKVAVGQFAVADTGNFLAPIDQLVKQMALVTDTPLYRFDSGGNHPSGESLRAAETPLNKKLSDRLAQFGVTWSEVFDYVLAVNGIKADAEIAWAPPAIWTDRDSWDSAVQQLAVGVPLDQVLRERGYAEDLISSWIANGQSNAEVVTSKGEQTPTPAPDTGAVAE
jgi:hypothetical protein